MRKMLLGVDIGTGGCKAVIVDSDGRMIATAYEEYKSDHLHTGWSEQNPAIWIDAFNRTVRSCLDFPKAEARHIACMGFSASTHNAVLLDACGRVLRPCIMWNDQRSAPQAKRLSERYGERIFELAMQMPTATWTMPQLQWIRENDPGNFAKIRRLVFTKDYVRGYVTGDFLTDCVDAQGSLLFDARKGEWSDELCDMINLDSGVLPPIVASKSIVGRVRSEVAEATGLMAGTPVIAGCSDTAAEDFGAGVVEEGQLLVKMATAGNVTIILSHPRPHPKGYTYPHAVQGLWYMATATNTSAQSFRWLRDALYATDKAQCQARGTDVYQLMENDATQAPVGAEGIIFHPYLLGERCPLFNADARAGFWGISMTHDKKHFARAVLEGVAFSLYDCFQVIREVGGNACEIRLIGGGAKSQLWCGIISDVFGLRVTRPEYDDSSFGDALLAGVGIGLFDTEVAAVRHCNRIKKIYDPDAENHKKYKAFFDLYKDITQASLPIWSKQRNLSDE